ncbi:leucine-rich repeat-containing protein 19-like [Myxocyprinus asiaticus]|uniref:leucine-rich repeat-containing protein 19-like n=1 Tax=Myxocyprinus asiaticus TaxID=70543 RepID=UPI0022230804|nr:leucine-rich repeat-containing protein 19-like [Myxocyprinus asiaticus]
MAGRQLHHLWVAAVLLTSGVTTCSVKKNGTSLTYIPAEETTNLTELILSYNKIEMSSSDIKALLQYPRLRELDLSHNLIQTLSPRAFDNLTNLETLNLRANHLQTLPKDIFKGLPKLKILHLEDNLWDCSCSLANIIKQLNNSGVSTGREITCYTSEKPPGKRVLDGKSFCSIQPTKVKISVEMNTSNTTATPLPFIEPTNSSHVNSSNKEISTGAAGKPTGSNSWKFLLGVVVITLSTSMLIICAVKSPSWYKLLFNYRHQRLHENVEPNVFNTGRYSNFSLDTEQTETSIQDLDEGLDHTLSFQNLEDDDGFIEDGYIEPGGYKDHTDIDES